MSDVNGVTSPSGEATAPATASEQLAALGPFFTAESHEPGSAAIAPWRPMSELADGPAVLADRVHAARAFLAAGSDQDTETVELRVAASVIHLGLVARTASPVLALAVLHGRTGPVTLRDLRWAPTTTPASTFPLSIAETVLREQVPVPGAAPELLAHAVGAGLIECVVTELCEAARPFAVSSRVLWGNVASALGGACTALADARPEHGPYIRAVLTALLGHPRLVATAQVGLDERFQRRSCCLIYRAAPDRAGAVCGDCVLLGRPRRPAAQRSDPGRRRDPATATPA